MTRLLKENRKIERKEPINAMILVNRTCFIAKNAGFKLIKAEFRKNYF